MSEALTYFKLRYSNGEPSIHDNIFEYIDALHYAGLLQQLYLEEVPEFRALHCNLVIQITTGNGQFESIGHLGYKCVHGVDLSLDIHQYVGDSPLMSQSIDILAHNGMYRRSTPFASILSFGIGKRVFIEADYRPPTL